MRPTTFPERREVSGALERVRSPKRNAPRQTMILRLFMELAQSHPKANLASFVRVACMRTTTAL